MQILSKDNYFILGVQALTDELNIHNKNKVVVFDTGSECVYFFYSDKLRHAKIKDSFSALVFFSPSFLTRKSTLAEYKKRFEVPFDKLTCNLTRREEMVIRGLYKASTAKQLACSLNISEKTISSHKVKGLRKLGIRNTVVLHSVLSVCNEIVSTINLDSAREINVI